MAQADQHQPPTLRTRLRRIWHQSRWRQVIGLDLRSLAVFRMALGALAIADVAQRSQDLAAHYTDWGLLPRGPLVLHFMHYAASCAHMVTGTSLGIGLLFALHAVLGLLLIVGYKSRTTAMALWFLTYGLHLRNPMVLQGGDDLLRMLMFWGMFLPLGARYSVDAALHQDAGRCSIVPGLSQKVEGAHLLVAWASLAFIGQQVLMYACTALFKTGAAWHDEASAVYYALNYDQLAKPLGIWLRQYTQVLPYLTHLTFAMEAMASFWLLCPLFFGPVRLAAILALMGMHHSFAACLVLGLFPWIDTAGLLALLPAWFWDKIERRIDYAAQREVIIYYDDACEFCKKMVQVLRVFMCLSEVQTRPAQNDPHVNAVMLKTDSWVVGRGGDYYTMWSAFGVLAQVSPITRGIAHWMQLRFITALGQSGYRLVANNRGALSQLSRRLCPWAPVPTGVGPIAQLIVALSFLLVVWWNVATLNGPALQVREPMRTWAYALRLDQRWDMFSPFPATDDGWFVIDGERADGRRIDVLSGKVEQASFDKPALVTASVQNQRWSKYMMNLWQARNADHRLYFGQYLCRKYNGQNVRRPESLVGFELYYVREDTLPDKIAEPQRVSLWRHDCFGQIKK